MKDFYVNLTPREAISKISNASGGDVIDEYVVGSGENAVTVTVYEQYYFRINGCVTLTAIVDKVYGKTHVRLVSAGGGYGILRFDWGTSKSMEQSVIVALSENIIN